MIRLILSSFIALLSSPLVTFAQNEQAAVDTLVLSLQESKDIAIENNFTIRDQLLDVRIAEAQVDQIKAQGLPQINANLDYQYTILNSFAERTSGEEDTTIPPLQGNYPSLSVDEKGDVQGIALESIGVFFSNIGDAFASKHASNVGLGVNQLVFDGAFLLGLKAAEVYVDLARIQTKPSVREINQAVEKAYYGVLVAESGLSILDKNIENIEKLLYETKKTYEAGFVEQLDVDRLNLALSILKNQHKNYVALLNFNYDVFKNTLNIPLSTQLELSEEIESFAEYATSDSLLQEVASPEQWPEFELLEAQMDINDLDIERIKKLRLPRVSAFLNGNYNYQGNEFIFNNGWYPNLIAGLGVSFPIFDGNLKRNQIKEAQIKNEKIQLSQEQLQVNINLQISNSLTQYLNARTNVQNQEENIALAEKIYQTTQIKYKEGVGSSVEMNQAQQDLYTAQQDYINSVYDLLIAKVDLEYALGK